MSSRLYLLPPGNPGPAHRDRASQVRADVAASSPGSLLHLPAWRQLEVTDMAWLPLRHLWGPWLRALPRGRCDRVPVVFWYLFVPLYPARLPPPPTP